MDPPPTRRRFTITLRGDSLPTPTEATPPTQPPNPHLPSLEALVTTLIPLPHPPEIPPVPTLTAQLFRAAQHPSARDRLLHVLARYSLDPNDAELDALQVAIQQVAEANADGKRPKPIDDASQRAQWDDQAAAVFDSCLLASGEGSVSTLPSASRTDPTVSAASSSQTSSSNSSQFEPAWLRLRCSQLAIVSAGDGLSPGEMAASVLTLLTDDSRSDEQLQSELFDAFGGDFDAVLDVLSRRHEIAHHADDILADCARAESVVAAAGPLRVGRGVSARRRNGGERRTQVSSQITVRDVRREAAEKEEKRTQNRLVRAGLLRNEEEEDTFEIGALGGSVYEERQRYFPDVEVEGDSVIGAVDRVGLPKGATREVGKGYEEIFVPPPARKGGGRDRLVDVAEALGEHPELLGAMKGVTRLNRLQSAVYPVAFGTDENLLVCAPTGAGKTNVALLTIFREIVAVKLREKRGFKVVYVAPMKALAAEVTEKFGKRLGGLGLRVKEFTGDMSLSRLEALETHVLVTTPEKWDVVTRKTGSELGDAVTLFIVDEIHLLHDDRGAVLESIVARTLRLSETAQKQIRLVGLSATLPNYKDVGEFMRVRPEIGLFHFDGSHRPVPLSQTFVGISEGGTSNSSEARRRREGKVHEMAWKKVKDSLQRGHQAMIFVHSRKGTSMAAREMLSRAAQDAMEDIFLGGEAKKGTRGTFERTNGEAGGEESSGVIPTWAAKEIGRSKTSNIRELCIRGVGIHNAGLPRSDRKLVEKLFAEGVIRLLCCTATLAWGVNLPARTVIIMGTELYDAQKGGFVQLGMLDVMQIFGRAGRPQFDTEGEGTIITTHEHLGKYLSLLTASVPIESTLSASASRLADHLNAEVVSGTVSTIGEGVRWLNYTYLSVRMPKNPLSYGIDWAEVDADSGLHARRANLIQQASKALDDARMCRYDPTTGVLAPTDLGRVASHFYVSHETIVLWNELLENLPLEPAVTEADWEEVYGIAIHAISCATEFEQMRSRQEESEELDYLRKEACPVPLKSGSESREGKVAILLQAHISRAPIRMSDLSYVVQSATRLLRALFEVSLRRGLPSLSMASLALARASECRIWPFQHPLRQFTYANRKASGLVVNAEVVAAIETSGEKGSIEELRAMTKEELSVLVRAPKMALTVQRAVKAIPTLTITKARIAPISRTVLKVSVSLFPSFRWNDAVHGRAESWWMWVEDHEEDRIYHSQKILLTKSQVCALNGEQGSSLQRGENTIDYSFFVPVFDPPSSQYWIRVESEQWHTGGGSTASISLSKMRLPEEDRTFTKLLDLRPLPVHAVLEDEEISLLEPNTSHFNPLQTQAFHSARHTDKPMLISAPYGAGKGLIADITILRSLQERPSSAIVYVVPNEETLALRKKRWSKLVTVMDRRIVVRDSMSTADVTCRRQDSMILLSTPNKWNHLASELDDDIIGDVVSLFVIEDLHLLSGGNRSEMEALVARTRQISYERNAQGKPHPRLVALSCTVPNAGALGQWLGVDRNAGFFSFSSDMRQVPCSSHVIGVAGDRYASRMQSMNRSLFSTIQRHSSKKPVLIYVSSRRQTLLTAQDLIRSADASNGSSIFTREADGHDAVISKALRDISDPGLSRCIASGIGLYHENMTSRECDAVESLYRREAIQILVVTFNMARGLEVPSHLVIVKGTEQYKQKERRYEDVPVQDILHMISQVGRPGIDSECHAVLFVHEPKKTLFRKFLYEALPIESAFHENIADVLLREIVSRRVKSNTDAVEFLTWTFLFQRLLTNPGYYGLLSKGDSLSSSKAQDKAELRRKDAVAWCAHQVSVTFEALSQSECIRFFPSFHVEATVLGRIAAAFGLAHSLVLSLSQTLARSDTLEKVLKQICFGAEVSHCIYSSNDMKAMDEAAERVCREFYNAKMYESADVAAKALGINKSADPDVRIARLSCCCAFLGSLRLLPKSVINYRQVYDALEKMLAVSFDLAVESGRLSVAMSVLKASQSLYQGLLPSDDVWILCGCATEKLAAKGREAGYTSISDVTDHSSDFNVFVAKNSDNEAQRTALSRWLGRFPRVEVRVRERGESNNMLAVDVEIRRDLSLSREGCETNSHFAQKRLGGYVLLVGNAQKDIVYSAKRLPGAGERKAVISEEVEMSPWKEDGQLTVWIMSDTYLGADKTVKIPPS